MIPQSTYSSILDKSSKKFQCPGCQQKTFVKYVSVSTGQYLPDEYGRCDRENNCGYFQQPKTDLLNNRNTTFVPIHQPPPVPDFIDNVIHERSLALINTNNLQKFLSKTFGEEIANELSQKYKYGTTKTGACLFWQKDINNKFRTGKVIQYNPETGKRSKEITTFMIHNKVKKDFSLVQCFFGEHLLNDDTSKPVSIVESEKSAIIASIYFPQFIWIATGGKYGCKWTEYHVCRVLRNRKVILFPDLGENKSTKESCYEYWNKRAAILRGHGINATVSSFLEKHPKVTEEDRSNGADLADFLLRFDYNEFLNLQKKPVKVETTIEVDEPKEITIPIAFEERQSDPVELWDVDVLEKFFASIQLPKETSLSKHEKITDVDRFLDAHLSFCKNNNGKQIFKPYYQRLQQVKDVIEDNRRDNR